jgi:hypothetical protein
MTKTRKKADKKTDGAKDTRMPTSVFVPLYLEAVAKGMTRQDFAESIGIQASSVYQRIHGMWMKGACKKTFPLLKARGKRPFLETVDRAVAAYRSGSVSLEPKKDLATAVSRVATAEEFSPQDELDRLLNG